MFGVAGRVKMVSGIELQNSCCFFTLTFDNFKTVQIQKRRVLVPPDTPEKQHQNYCSGICCILLHNHCSCLCHQTAGNEVQSYSSSVAIHQHNSVAVNSGSSYGGLDQWMAVGLFESLHHCLLFSFFLFEMASSPAIWRCKHNKNPKTKKKNGPDWIRFKL